MNLRKLQTRDGAAVVPLFPAPALPRPWYERRGRRWMRVETYERAKRVMDLGMCLLALPFVLLVIGACVLLIRLDSPGPAFFVQSRTGRGGRRFRMFKLRTMFRDADELKAKYMHLNELAWPDFKITNDPRITPVGRWLRKYSIDEWPQFINVVRGEMSLVGPRPLPIDEVERFDDPAHRRRLSVKPGLTCLWQVSGRNNVRDFSDWVRLDLEYIDNWSLWLDLKILWRTIPVVLAGTGAK